MSDAMVTPPLLSGADRRTSTPERAAAELKRMRREEPHLYRAMKAEMEALRGDILTAGDALSAAEAAQARAERIVAGLYVALRLGHERLWKSESGIPDLSGPAGGLSVELREEVRGLLSKGRKVEAIRRIREAAGLGLKEAKDIADHLEKELP